MMTKRYLPPVTSVDDISTRIPCLQTVDPWGDTSMQLTNRHHWEEEILNEGLDDSPYANTAPHLWDEDK